MKNVSFTVTKHTVNEKKFIYGNNTFLGLRYVKKDKRFFIDSMSYV